MKAFTALLCALVTSVPGGRLAADSQPRTDINPALLYWQAFAVLPDYTSQGYLFTNEWRGRALDEEFNTLIQPYDVRFRLLEQAAAQKTACDWGYDLSQGPELLLPGLAKVKQFAQAARLRMRWHLENGRPEAARDEFLATLALARQTARGGVLIGTLVQFASENILLSGLAENWFRFTPETLKQLLDGLDSAPVRGTVAESIPMERTSFRDWLARKVEGFQASSGSEAEALERTRAVLHSFMDPSEAPEGRVAPTPDGILESAGNSTAGLLRQLKEMDALYDEADALMKAPYREFQPGIKAFNEKIAHHPNQLVQVFFPAFEKCRVKEFAIEMKLAMVRAAAAYRLAGAARLASVPDPVAQAPFDFQRFVFNGTDRGFELRSKTALHEWPDTLIFVEKDGPAFHLDGPSAGKAVK
ncbi:MAG TPA: hypothetical protein VMB21_10105 [Candidatus Limnocylindria bacterium]|nr:hypothetical protein [Candidatus Limnocylindria bacterium]